MHMHMHTYVPHLEHHAPLDGSQHGEVDEGLSDDVAHDTHLRRE